MCVQVSEGTPRHCCIFDRKAAEVLLMKSPGQGFEPKTFSRAGKCLTTVPPSCLIGNFPKL